MTDITTTRDVSLIAQEINRIKVDAVTAGRFREAFQKTMLQMAQRMAEA